MNLFILSFFVILATLSLQQLHAGNLFDLLTPLLVSVGLVASKKTIVIWTLCMAFFWSALTAFSFFILAVIWGLTLWIIHIIARGIEWRKPERLFFMAAIASFEWHFSLLLLAWFDGRTPTMDTNSILSIIIQPITSGIVTAMLGFYIVKAVNPLHPLLRSE